MAAAVTPAPASHKVSGRWQDSHRKMKNHQFKRSSLVASMSHPCFGVQEDSVFVLIRYLEAMAGYINLTFQQKGTCLAESQSGRAEILYVGCS